MAVSLGEKKQKLNSKLFAQLTKKQVGQTDSLMAKVLKNMHDDLDSTDVFARRDGTAAFLKFYNHLMPKSAGTVVNLNQNNLRIGGKQGVDMIETLTDFMRMRAKKIEAVESRTVQVSSEPEVNQKKEILKLPANYPRAKGLPAGSPGNPG